MTNSTDLFAEFRRDLKEVRDRQAIVDCINRYCRGVDRLDEELLRSSFHEDGALVVDDKTVQSISEFVEAYWSRQGLTATPRDGFPARPTAESAQHYIMNVSLMELGDEWAYGETYFIGIYRFVDETVDLVGGRYVDRFERRDGVWRIARKTVIRQWALCGLSSDEGLLLGALPNRRDTDDISYERVVAGGQ